MTIHARMAAIALGLSAAFACGSKPEPPPATVPPSTAAVMEASFDPATMPPATATAPAAAATTSTTAPVARASAAKPAAPATTIATTMAAPPPAAAATSAPPTTAARRPAAPATTVAAAPAKPAAARPKGKVTLPAKPGAVTFDHEAHATTHKVACATCHHASKPQKPLAAEQQACRECHTTPAKAPMKTSMQAAFHDPLARKGLCVDCHKQKGGKAPLKCAECHKKG